MSLLHDIQTGTIPGAMVDGTTPTVGAVTSTPQQSIDSKTFLQESCFTGIQVSVPLPLGAIHGFQPMFAVRVDPLTHTPTFSVAKATQDLLRAVTSDTNYSSIYPNKGQLPVRVYNGATFKFTGPEPPQSLFSRMYRYWRGDIVYNIRIVSTYTGGGILMIVPVKGVPRGTTPMLKVGNHQILANGMLVNSNMQCDLSKSRQFRFVYPYEYPTEFLDLAENRVDSSSYDAISHTSATEVLNLDNWFIVGTRGSIITPTNATTLEFYIDYAFGQHSLHTPLLPIRQAMNPSVSIWTNGESTQYFEFTENDFPDVTPVQYNSIVFTNNTTSALSYHKSNTGQTTDWTSASLAVGASVTIFIPQLICFGSSSPSSIINTLAYRIGVLTSSGTNTATYDGATVTVTTTPQYLTPVNSVFSITA